MAMQRSTACGASVALLLVMCGLRGALAIQLQMSPLKDAEHGHFLAEGAGGSLVDDPPGADYDQQTRVSPEGSPILVTVEGLVAMTWITMVASMPILVMWYEGKQFSKTTIGTALVMWIVFFGGIWLFTNSLNFQSAHRDGHRSLTLVEFVYLMAQILMTVGYGDITPVGPSAQAFVALYVLFTLLIIANVVSQVSSLVDQQTREACEQLEEALQKKLVNSNILGGTIEDERQALSKVLAHKFPPLPWNKLFKSLLGWLFWVALGVVFYSNYPGENKTVFESIYFSIITLSTVGFGDLLALTEAGKAFGAFWMLSGSFYLVVLVGSFTELMSAMRLREKWNYQKALVHEDALFKALPERIDLQAFMKFALEYTSLVTREDLDIIEGTFQELAPSSGGKITRRKALALYE